MALMSVAMLNTINTMEMAGMQLIKSQLYWASQDNQTGAPEHRWSVLTPQNRSLTGNATNAPNTSMTPTVLKVLKKYRLQNPPNHPAGIPTRKDYFFRTLTVTHSEMINPCIKKFVLFFNDSLLLAGSGWLWVFIPIPSTPEKYWLSMTRSA